MNYLKNILIRGRQTGSLKSRSEAILLYQRVTVNKLPSCRYIPSCPEYAYEAIDAHRILEVVGIQLRGCAVATHGESLDMIQYQREAMLEFLEDILYDNLRFFPNYAFAIIIFTCLVMIVLTPVTLKQTRSMLAM